MIDQEKSRGDGSSLFSPTSSFFKDLDAWVEDLDTTIENTLKDVETEEVGNSKGVSFQDDDDEDDDDLNEEVQQLETSQHALWEEMVNLNISAISGSSADVPVLGTGMTPEKENCTMDTLGLLAESERLISVVKETPSTVVKQTPSTEMKAQITPDNEQNLEGFTVNLFKSPYISPRSFQEQQNSMFPIVERHGNTSLMSPSDARQGVASPSNNKENEESLSSRQKGKTKKRRWFKFPKGKGTIFGGRKRNNGQSVQEESRNDQIDLKTNHTKGILKEHPTPEKPEGLRSNKKRVRISDDLEASNKKLKRQNGQLLNMLADAWRDKVRTQSIHDMKTMYIVEKMQQKLTVAQSKSQELENENQMLKIELEMLREKISKTHKLEHEAMQEWQEQIEQKMRARYKKKLQKEVTKRIKKHAVDLEKANVDLQELLALEKQRDMEVNQTSDKSFNVETARLMARQMAEEANLRITSKTVQEKLEQDKKPFSNSKENLSPYEPSNTKRKRQTKPQIKIFSPLEQGAQSEGKDTQDSHNVRMDQGRLQSKKFGFGGLRLSPLQDRTNRKTDSITPKVGSEKESRIPRYSASKHSTPQRQTILS